MAISLNGALVAVAADFTGKYSPYQSIQIRPNPRGGVFVASTDAGRIAFLGFDPSGKGDEQVVLLPTADLIKQTRPLKSATRWLELEGNVARCTKLMKTTSATEEVPITRSTTEPADLIGAMKAVAERWGKDCPVVNAGNFNANFLLRAFKAIEQLGGSITMSHLDGGPLRVESTTGNAIVLVMPEMARDVPPLPDYLHHFVVS